MYTHWLQGKTEKGKSTEYFKIFEKNTIFDEHPVVSGVVKELKLIWAASNTSQLLAQQVKNDLQTFKTDFGL